MLRLTAIDFNAGLGGRSLIWQNAGFKILAATEDNALQRNIYSMLMPKVPLLSSDQLKELPPADIIIGSFPFQQFSVSYPHGVKRDQAIVAFSEMLSRVAPKAFVLQLPTYSLRTESFSVLATIVSENYRPFYQMLKISDYSGLPISGNQLYFAGIRNDISAQFQFPAPTSYGMDRPLFRELPHTVDPWYRKLPPTMRIPSDLLEGQFFYYSFGREPRVTEQMPSSNPRRCFLIDALGPRRITITEYGYAKGYPESLLGQLSPSQRMYDILQQAPDLHVADAIAHKLYFSLVQDHSVEAPAQTSHSSETNKPQTQKLPVEESGSIVEPRNNITELYIEKLKGLKDLRITFGPGLTAIMGVNGAGKSTILHALACMFSPFRSGEDHKFNFYFTPTPDASWQGSLLFLTYFDENTQSVVQRKYGKFTDRWTPRYSSRPKRDVFYIGIDSGLPEIEKERQTSFIDYLTDVDGDKLSSRVAATASKILRKNYQLLTTHKSKHKVFFGVRTKTDITYSSLSMGAGEQRLIKILTAVFHAKPYSLILIDELDLLLHVDAQRQLVEALAQQAKQKHLQIIFTTHSLTVGQLVSLTEVRYLYHTCEKTIVFDHITSDIIYDLCRETEQPLSIYVEDDVSAAVVSWVARALKLSRHTQISNIGSASNAFTLAAGWVLEGRALDNRLIILDGDVYRTAEEKSKQLNNVLSGTEHDHNARIDQALSVLCQFRLPDATAPEKFIYDLIIRLDIEDEITECAKQITSVTNSHDWIDEIVNRMHQERQLVLYRIIDLVSDSEQWPDYIAPVQQWLTQRKEALNLVP